MDKMLFKFLVITFILLNSILSFADDSMWMPHQMGQLDLKALGLQMNPNDLYKKDGTGLMSAVVSLGGGTGEFVSKDGLILTNHHVVFRALQRASDAEHDYIQNGFVALDRKEEIPAQGYIADVLQGYEDVTAKINSVVKRNMTFRQEYDAIDKIKKKLIAEAENAGKDIRCRIASMYSSNSYYLFKFKRLRDIRIVYAPPRNLGNFGGEVDNWMWPRHTCDFAFLRAYISKDNIGTEYRKENVAYEPKSIIKISLKGVRERDFTFVMGYPGRTYRNFTLSELLNDLERIKENIESRKEVIAFFEDATKDNKSLEIKYAGKLKGLYNGLKNYQGKLDGMERIDLVQKKKVLEDQFSEWINADPTRLKRYGTILKQIGEFIGRYQQFSQKNRTLSQLTSNYYGSTVLSQAHLIYRTVQERHKSDMEREPEFQDRNFDRLKMDIKLAERGYDFETDKSFFRLQLTNILSRPTNEVPSVLRDSILKKSVESVNEYVNALFAQTKLADPNKRLKYVEMSPEELEELDDPMIQLAASLEKEMEVYREENKSLRQEQLDLKKVYMEAVLKMKNGKIAPDANGTIRFTCGNVEGYHPRDAVRDRPLTTVKGVIEKDRGESPFNVPNKLKDIHHARDFGPYIDTRLNDVPACFLNTTNVTGGNSGSPTLNAKGEQVGIIFDMTYESVIGDYYVIPELQRTISVDIRYVLFITDKFSGAAHLLKEMGL